MAFVFDINETAEQDDGELCNTSGLEIFPSVAALTCRVTKWRKLSVEDWTSGGAVVNGVWSGKTLAERP